MENPDPDDLYRTGTAATILKLIKMPDGSVSIVIQGKRRFEVGEFTQTEPYLRANATAIDELAAEGDDEAELAAHVRSIKELAVQIVNLSPNLPSEAAYAIQNIESPGFLVHFITSNLQIEVEKKQAILETRPLLERAELVLEHLEQEIRANVAAEHQADLDAQKKASEAEIREIRENIQVEIASKIRSRLLQLAAKKRD